MFKTRLSSVWSMSLHFQNILWIFFLFSPSFIPVAMTWCVCSIVQGQVLTCDRASRMSSGYKIIPGKDHALVTPMHLLDAGQLGISLVARF